MSDICEQFRAKMSECGIDYSGEIIGDGQIHRFKIEGDRQGTLNGAYVLFNDSHPAGWFQNWKTGLKINVRLSSQGSISRYDALSYRPEYDPIKIEEKRLKSYSEAASKALYLWGQARPITEQSQHSYLTEKQIQPHGIRILSDSLIVPIRNSKREIVNLQFIDSQGIKRFLPKGQISGNFFPIGNPGGTILVCEGYATAASLHEDAGLCTIAAMTASNLAPVSEVIRKMFPAAEIIICGDNDQSGIGQTKAREAARKINAKVSIPPVPGCDWNDFLTQQVAV